MDKEDKAQEATAEYPVEAPESPSPGRKLSKNGKPLGRPRKSDIAAKKAPGKVGRPKGDAAIMNDYKARMIASPKSEKVLKAVMDTAMDPEHKHFVACSKMVLDRLLPLKAFEETVTKSSGKTGVEIKIVTAGNVHVDETIDAEFTEVAEAEE